MESYVSAYTLAETDGNWKGNQHGGRKGSGTDHVLIDLWDKILTDLDSGPNKADATVLCGVDFSKSFSRCSYQEILMSYVRLGANQWILDMHSAFLTNRTMAVKVGNTISPPRAVTGGAVQGSILGVMDHNAVMEFVDEGFTVEAQKYVEDMTTVETIPKSSVGYMNDAYDTQHFHAEKTEESIKILKQTCEAKNLKINAAKTQLLAI